MPSDEAKRLRKSLSTAVHAGADRDGVSSSRLRRADVYAFLNLDTTDYEDARELGRVALIDFCIGTDGDWESIWRTLLPSVIAFMQSEGYGGPDRSQFAALAKMVQSRPNPEALGAWFDEVFPH